jgi:DNA invertase Pin-like site-specific DNA recombinase
VQYIYARVSTDRQTSDNQTEVLTSRYPDARVVQEVGSGVKKRPALDNLLAELRKGDEIVVFAIDRLGRSVVDLANILDKIADKGAVLVSMREGTIDKKTPMGNFMYNIMASLAQIERDILIERTKAGLERARRAGKKLGGPRSISDETRLRIAEMRRQGHTLQSIASEVKVSKTRVHEIIKETST